MKKIIALLLAGTMVLSFVGCSKTEEKSSSTVQEKQKETKEVTDKEEPMTIEWFGYNPYAEMDPDKATPIVEYMEEKFNVKLNVWYIPDASYDEMINVRIAGGDMPDIMKIKGGSLGTYVEQGVVGELPFEVLEKYAPDLYAYSKERVPDDSVLWMPSMYKGKNYGFPSIKRRTLPSLVMWRKDWLDKFGYNEQPTTIDEFEEVLTKFTYEDPDENGVDDTYGMSDFGFNMVFGAYGVGELSSMDWFGTNRVMRDGLPTFACIQPETKEALATLADWYQKGLIDPEFVTSEHTSGHWSYSNAFTNGRIGLTGRSNAGHWKPDEEGNMDRYDDMLAINPKAEVLFGLPPVGPRGDAGTNTGSLVKCSIVLTTQATNDSAKTAKLLEIVNEKFKNFDHAVMLDWGIEGQHYEIDPTTKEYLSILPEGENSKTYGLGIFGPLMKSETSVAYLGDLPDYEIDRTAGRDGGYTQPTVPTTEIYSANAPDLRRMAAEAFITIVSGEKDIDYFDEFVEKYLENGGQASIDAMQQAYKETLGME